MICRLVLVIFFLSGCVSSSQKTIKSRFFADVDIRLLEGLNEVAPHLYPNIEIADSENCRILKYHIDDSHFIQRSYIKDRDNWVLNFFEKDDTANIYTTRIIYPRGLVEFSYIDTSKNRIYDVGILIKDTMLYYRPKNEYNRKLNLEDLESIMKYGSPHVKFWFDTTSKSIQIKKLFYDQIDNKSDSPIVTCYPKNNRSFFWWYEVQYYQPSILCN